ncbi:hypothetical protein LTR10_022962 [Elasticomyces elasticus]|uniref:Fe2OG dioxygenase domain-containing protein n=1 Tax=Exophiala sideris TaxID=1016849 RepID=A0ABR0IZA2_9EURO|nr:hypothetical protein LTR10_022962 [Elasticomyces elasticus]KAK5022697.1 hypothetical protein LTS07_009920 [Exophiala sideris]KAK5027639.1 hypothetical protein LTR13_009346 [Exophiala sideris]KAK5052273.1 hypothetical protein LTR69_010035 [Exophiala sideris]KAK5177930.1 hypothetical protein LTR44_009479 [Eurotiomycetes sp. CCFEE 6388]
MADILRVTPEGHREVRTGLGWRRVLSSTSSDATTQLSVIDMSDAFHPELDRRKALARKVCDAAINSGFFYVSNHGIPDTAVESIMTETKRFFHDLTLEEKMEYDTEKHDHYYGYYPIKLNPNQPAGAKLNEGINYGYEPSTDPDAMDQQNNGDNWWPSEGRLPGYRENVSQYMGHVLKLSRCLLRMFALGLGFDEDEFDYLATRPYSILKMAHYPGELSGTEEPSSIRPHTDFELLTILLQDTIPSLEVLSNTGQWIQAKPIPGTFVVNIGDSLSMLTNGLFMSTMHRVLNTSRRARYSVPFFLGANQEAIIKALDKFVTCENPARFQPMTSGEYIRRSLQLVYTKPDTELIHETIEIQAQG